MKLLEISKLHTYVYLLDLDETSQYPEEYCIEHFPNRYEDSKKFKFTEDRLRSIGVGILLYEVLGLEESEISVDESGKPTSDATSMQFSISHSGDYTLLAVSDRLVGVDLERADRKYMSILNRVLTESEKDWFGKMQTLVQTEHELFMKIWTLKESVSKALGLGLALDFRSFDVIPMLEGKEAQIEGHSFIGHTQTYGHTENSEGYILSVCVEN